MSKFYEDQKSREEARARAERRKEKLASYLYDLSKLSFGGVVIGASLTWLNNTGNTLYIIAIIVGLLIAIEFAIIANELLK